MDHLHERVKTGYLDGQYYDKNRPSFTDEVVQQISRIIQKGRLPEETNTYDCLELGAGTGKFTEKIITCLPKGIKYLSTEPMSGFLETLKAKCLPLETMQCPAEKIPLTDNSVTTVVAAQCFHWFANEVSLNEIYRVLAPKGTLALVFNIKLWNEPWLQEVRSLVSEYFTEARVTSPVLDSKWKEVIEMFQKFKCIQHSLLDGIRWHGNREEILDYFGTFSVFAAFDDKTKQVVLQKFREIIDRHFNENINELAMTYETVLYVCRKE